MSVILALAIIGAYALLMRPGAEPSVGPTAGRQPGPQVAEAQGDPYLRTPGPQPENATPAASAASESTRTVNGGTAIVDVETPCVSASEFLLVVTKGEVELLRSTWTPGSRTLAPLPAGRYLIRCERPLWKTIEQTLLVTETPTPVQVQFRMSPTVCVTGSVTKGNDSSPVQEFDLRLEHEWEEPFGVVGRIMSQQLLVAHPSGRFALAGDEERATKVRAHVTADGFLPLVSEWTEVMGGVANVGELWLQEGQFETASLNGCVRDESGHPVVGAYVRLLASGATGRYFDSRYGLSGVGTSEPSPILQMGSSVPANDRTEFAKTKSVSDSDGHFALQIQVPARVRVFVWKRGYLPFTSEYILFDRGAGSEQIDVTLSSGVTLVGEVVSPLGLLGELNVDQIRLATDVGHLVAEVHRDGSNTVGTFRFPGVVPGVYMLEIQSYPSTAFNSGLFPLTLLRQDYEVGLAAEQHVQVFLDGAGDRIVLAVRLDTTQVSTSARQRAWLFSGNVRDLAFSEAQLNDRGEFKIIGPARSEAILVASIFEPSNATSILYEQKLDVREQTPGEFVLMKAFGSSVTCKVADVGPRARLQEFFAIEQLEGISAYFGAFKTRNVLASPISGFEVIGLLPGRYKISSDQLKKSAEFTVGPAGGMQTLHL